MSVKIERVRLEEGDSLFVQFNGSAEVCLAIFWPPDGKPTVVGPQSTARREFTIEEAGMTEVTANVELRGGPAVSSPERPA